MAANRRRLVHRLQAEDPLDLSALERQAYSWSNRLGKAWLVSAKGVVAAGHSMAAWRRLFADVALRRNKWNVDDDDHTPCLAQQHLRRWGSL